MKSFYTVNNNIKSDVENAKVSIELYLKDAIIDDNIRCFLEHFVICGLERAITELEKFDDIMLEYNNE